jgi:hypothetical protein
MAVKIYPMAIKYINFSAPRPSKIYKNRDFWYEDLATLELSGKRPLIRGRKGCVV